MKKYIFFIFIISSFGCTKKTDLPNNKPIQEKAIINDLFSNTWVYPEDKILESAKENLFQGRYISSENAKKCWELESKRNKIQLICLALWLNGDQKDSELEQIVKSNLNKSLDVTILAIKNKTLIQTLTFDQFSSLLDNIPEEIKWLQLEAINYWLEKNSFTDQQKNTLLFRLNSFEASFPIEYTLIDSAFNKLGENYDQKILSSECSGLQNDITRSRCWRLISTIIQNATIEQKARLRLFIPEFNDLDWIFFRRNYPHRARIIEINFQ